MQGFSRFIIMWATAFVIVILMFLIPLAIEAISDKLLIRKAKANNWITDGHCWSIVKSGVISNIGYSGEYQMVATYTYKVGKHTYEKEKEFYPNKDGKFNYNSDATIYYNAYNPYKCVIIPKQMDG